MSAKYTSMNRKEQTTEMPANPDQPYRYICVEGNIGAGKTSLSTRLAGTMGSRIIHERFSDNPFLSIFYENPQRHAFPVELHFLMERYRQLQAELMNASLFEQSFISDYCPQKSLLFARKTMGDEEFRLFRNIYDALYEHVPQPDIILFINRQLPTLVANIHNRGRAYELDIQDSYLLSIHDSYRQFFMEQQEIPIIWLGAEHADFLGNEDHFGQVLALLRQSFEPGLHYIDIGGD